MQHRHADAHTCCEVSRCCVDRWFSSILIHTSFQHVLSNMLLFVVLSWQIEEKYGAFRVAFIFFWSAIGGEPELGLSLSHNN